MPMRENDNVPKIVTLPRWEREWLNSHRSINFSGLVQMHISKIIKEYDPDYFKIYEHLLKEKLILRKDNLEYFKSLV